MDSFHPCIHKHQFAQLDVKTDFSKFYADN